MAARVYTQHGDDGSTGQFLGGRVAKSDPIVEPCGGVDEAGAAPGWARAGCSDEVMAAQLLDLQRQLFVVGGDLATNPDRRDKLQEGVSAVTDPMVDALEAAID